MLRHLRIPALFYGTVGLLYLMIPHAGLAWALTALAGASFHAAYHLVSLLKSAGLSEQRAQQVRALAADLDAAKAGIERHFVERMRTQEDLARAHEETQAVKLSNDELAGHNQRLAELNLASQRLVDEVSHDFRTPLSVIKGYSEIIHEGMAGPLSAEQTQYSQLIIDRTRDLAQMVDDLLDMNKIRAGSLRVDRALCDVAAIFRSLHPAIDSRAAANGVHWIEELEPGLPQVFADAEKAARTLVNIVLNAIKLSPEGGRVAVSANSENNGDVRISVANEGAGLSPENLASLLEQFRRAGQPRAAGKGFGLALNVANEMALLNLGRMSAESEPRKGSIISFTLPVNEPATIIARLFASLETRETAAGSLSILRVTPERGGEAPPQLRGFLASTAAPTDLIVPARDGAALIVCGYSVQPAIWFSRFEESGRGIEPFKLARKTCAFHAELVGVLDYPGPQEMVVAMINEQINEQTNGKSRGVAEISGGPRKLPPRRVAVG